MTLPRACLPLIPVLFAAAATAQGPEPKDLQQRLLQACRDGRTEDAADAIGGAAVGELVDAFADGSPLLGAPSGQLGRFVAARADELVRHWLAVPAVRARTRTLFRRVPADWARCHANGDEALRRDVLALAEGLSTGPLLRQRFDADPRVRASARELIRVAGRAARSRDGRATRAALAGEPQRGSFAPLPTMPFELVRGLTDTDAEVRAAAALLLRRQLRLAPSPWGAGWLVAHPHAAIRTSARPAVVDSRGLRRLFEAIRRGGSVGVVNGIDFAMASEPARRDAAYKLVDLMVGRGGSHASALPDPSRADRLLELAQIIHPSARLHVLRHAAADRRLRAPLLERLARGTALAPVPSKTARDDEQEAILLTMLDDPNAARVLAAFVVEGVRAETAAHVERLALEVLRDRPERIAAMPDPEVVCDWTMSRFVPANRDSWIVVAASGLPSPALIAPLLAARATALAGPGLADGRQGLPIFDGCLIRLAANATGADADALARTLLADRPVGARLASAADQALVQLSGRCSSVVLAEIVRQRPALQRAIEQRIALDPRTEPDRARALIRKLGVAATLGPAAFRRFPELLLEAWRDGVDRTSCHARLQELVAADPTRAERWLREWPAAFVAGALALSPAPAVSFAVVSRIVGEPAVAGRPLVALLHACTLVEADLPVLLELAERGDPELLLMVCRRAHALSPAGRAAAKQLLERALLGDDRWLLRAATSVAFSLAVVPSGWQRAADVLAKDAPQLVAAMHVRFGGARLADVDGDPAQVARLLGEPVAIGAASTPVELARWLRDRDRSPSDRVAALTAAGALAEWNDELLREVVAATVNADASVRRAAYAALAGLDGELWIEAWLVYEAALDPDPDVRAVAPTRIVR